MRIVDVWMQHPARFPADFVEFMRGRGAKKVEYSPRIFRHLNSAG